MRASILAAFLTLAALPALATLPALAQAPLPPQAPARIRGTIVSANVQQITVHTRDNHDVTIFMAPATTVASVSLTQLADVHPGSFIGVTAVPQPDGAMRALEVHIFPESMRGTGEGFRPWDVGPQSTMTNGTVGQITGADGRTLTVAYKDGAKTIAVPPDVPVMAFEPSVAAGLTPGAHVLVIETTAADGTMTANRAYYGKDGIDLPL